jgi:UDP-glucose 4-epimerase
VYATYLLLEQLTRSSTQTLVFTSSSTVYGDPQMLPTPESHPTQPISIYGAAKLASEALIHAYARTFTKRSIILRLANIIGPRAGHGVIHDFIQKLRNNPAELEILGDGTQTKSYLHVDDLVTAVQTAIHRCTDPVTVLNVGSTDQTSVTEIAEIVTKAMNLHDTTYRYTGGIDGGRGWKGDVKTMLLDVHRLNALGWTNRYSSNEAVDQTVHAYLHP